MNPRAAGIKAGGDRACDAAFKAEWEELLRLLPGHGDAALFAYEPDRQALYECPMGPYHGSSPGKASCTVLQESRQSWAGTRRIIKHCKVQPSLGGELRDVALL